MGFVMTHKRNCAGIGKNHLIPFSGRTKVGGTLILSWQDRVGYQTASLPMPMFSNSPDWPEVGKRLIRCQ